jgi:hypothetical protein
VPREQLRWHSQRRLSHNAAAAYALNGRGSRALLVAQQRPTGLARMSLPGGGGGGGADGGAADSSAAAAESVQPWADGDNGTCDSPGGSAADAAPAGAAGADAQAHAAEDAHDATALPTAALRAAALHVLGETDAVRHTALAQLRAALATLPPPPAAAAAATLPPLDTSDGALLCLLRARAFDVAAAATLAANGRAFAAAHPAYFGLSRDTLLAVAASAFLVVLPALSHGGHRVIALQPARMPLDAFPPAHLFGFQLWVLSRLQRDPAVQVHGLASLSSYDGLFWRHFRLMPLSDRIAYQRDVYTPRYGPIHVWSLPRVGALFAAVKKLLPASVTAHVRVHGAAGDGGEAAELMPLRDVPRAFGGQLEDEALHMRAWMERQIALEEMGL